LIALKRAALGRLHSGRQAATAAATGETMKTNVGMIDRLLRAGLGVLLIALTLTGTIGVWGWIGLVPLATAALSYCPLYQLLGFSTCPLQKS
jgi:Protein of unknown function (DUF2892)